MRLILPLHVRRLVVLAGFALVLPVVVMSPASGAPIDDKRAEAARIAQELEVEGNKASMAAEGFNQARLKLAEVQGSLAKVQSDVARADARMQQAQGLLAQVAVQSYVTGGSTSFFAKLANSDNSNVVLRQQYLRFTASDQREVMGEVRAAREDFAAAQERLADEQSVAAEAASRAEAAQRKAAEAEAAQRNLLGRVQGELGTLVAEETARREAAQVRAAPPIRDAGPASSPIAGSVNTSGSGGPRSGPASQPARPAGALSPEPVEVFSAPPPSGGAATAVAAAKAEVGKPYVYGGAGPDSFDCSGLMQWAWGKAGVSLSHSAQSQYHETTRVPVSDMQPGDIIFFGSSTSSIGHDAMYVGGGSMVEAPRTGLNVRIVGVRDGIVGVGRPG